ncbi:MAG: putative ABC transporter permease [Coriobacteriaceae bacterium]|nr:putative ABC transporter permease [Coriobacteriaceae bacterium]
MDSAAVLIASFALYSCAGWLFESILCSISEKRVINRGFLNGPVCPIYGVGALAAVLFLSGIDDTAKLFCWGAIVCSVIEYFTSWAMEKLFHARWWDYSDRFLNLNGRICVPATLLFGFFIVLVVDVIQPAFMELFAQMSPQVLSGACGVFLAIFAADMLVTGIGLSGFRNKIDAYCAQLTEQAARVHDVITEGDNPVADRVRQLKASPIAHAYVRLRELMPGPVAIEDIGHSLAASFSAALNDQERRVMDAFPRMRISVPGVDRVRALANSAREKLLGP